MFSTFLKLPTNGVREGNSGNLANIASSLIYWTTSIATNPAQSRLVSIFQSGGNFF